MMVRYLKNKRDHEWKLFLTEAINKAGGCGESGVYMEMKKYMLNGVTDYYKEMMGAWGEFVRCVKYECKNMKQVWEQPVFLNPKITVEGETIFNRVIWRAGIRKLRDMVYEYIPCFMRAQVIVDEVRRKGDEIWPGTAEGVIEKIKKAMPKEWMEMIERENVMGGEDEIDMCVGEGECKLSLANVKTRAIYECMRRKELRRPAAEKVWVKVMDDMDAREYG